MKYSEALCDMINDNGIGTHLTAFAVTFYGVADDSNPIIPEPHLAATANGHIRLCTFTNGGVGLTWDTSAGGSIARLGSESATGDCVAAGRPRFARIHLLTDTNGSSADPAAYRLQATCGTTAAFDCILDSTFYPMVYTTPTPTVYSLGNIVHTLPLSS